jgi:hypothetical protein
MTVSRRYDGLQTGVQIAWTDINGSATGAFLGDCHRLGVAKILSANGVDRINLRTSSLIPPVIIAPRPDASAATDVLSNAMGALYLAAVSRDLGFDIC